MSAQIAPSLLRYSSQSSSSNNGLVSTINGHTTPSTTASASSLTRDADATDQASRPPAKPRLLRSRSELAQSASSRTLVPTPPMQTASDDSDWHLRHGWDYSAEQLRDLSGSFYLYFNDKRHESGGVPRRDNVDVGLEDWRMRDRLKTVSAVLAICLNIGVDPPDVIKTNPCARLECWIDPTLLSATPGHTPMAEIGRKLQTQYEFISIRTRYKLIPDPTVEEMKKYCCTLRKTAKDERILFHYNGHGVPKPTASGEIWVFNKTYTQYIPISLHDLQNWLAAPALFVYDCSDAALIIKNYNKFIEKQDPKDPDIPPEQHQTFTDCIHLAACAEGENLPTNPRLPADLFTSCLTSPIEMAIRFFIMQNPLPDQGLEFDVVKLIPGKASERRTPIGELNWIFTAITDTIAWNTLPKPLFKKLFRQDLMVAALFRNFLLAQRIMRIYGCHPKCHPEIPQCYDHSLWDSWDLAIEMVLSQLPKFREAKKVGEGLIYDYTHSDFFAEQLTAFEVYLGQGAIEQKEPEQLPIVLQVLLSQVHRLRALILLSKFLDLGPWAVKLALGIGIFPYVLKLLQSQAVELKPVMIFIWARILAVDQTCQADLLKDNGYAYFISILHPSQGMPIRDVSEHRAMCAFIIAIFCKNFRQGQAVAQSPELIENCLGHTLTRGTVDHPVLRQWSCLCLSMLWKDCTDARWLGIRCRAHTRLCESIWDPVPEVRAAMLHALTTFIGIPELTQQLSEIEEGIASRVLMMSNDGSSLVRKELTIFFSTFVKRYSGKFIVAAFEQMLEEIKRNPSLHGDTNGFMDEEDVSFSEDTIFTSVWKHVLILSVDPDPEVAEDAAVIVDFVLIAINDSPLGSRLEPLVVELLRQTKHAGIGQGQVDPLRTPSHLNAPPSPTASHSGKLDGYFSLGMKRTASVAASLKNLAFGPPTSIPDHMLDLPRQSNSVRTSRSERPTPSRPHSVSGFTRPLTEITFSAPGIDEKAKFPASRHGRVRSEQEKRTLPLESTFFDWSVEYFRDPQMKPNEADEPGSVEYNGRLWRRNRNEKILESTQRLKEQAGSSRWDVSAGFFDNGVQPMKMTFHQYDNQLAVADNRDTVRIWDWQRQKPLARFSNGNPSRSKITGIRFINEDDQALLMTGSSDGIIKLFRNYDNEENVHMVSSFRALTDLVPSTHNAGLIFDWLQGRGWALVAGDAKVIRVWNAASETCTNDIPARSGSCVTSLTSDQVEGNVFVAGFGDGAVRVYDQREHPTRSRVQQWKEHNQWITNIHMQRGGQRELVSGCRNGDVKLWDIRMGKSLRTIRGSRDNLRSFSVHEHAPIFATGSEKHNLRVYNMSGPLLSSFEPYAGFLQPNKSAPISETAFHPHRMILAASSMNDHHVNLFTCADRQRPSVDTT